MSKPVLGYWNIRGLCNPIRFLLAYLRVDYEEKLYTATDAGTDMKEWFENKFELGLQFPNLPYWIEGDLKLTESRAILKYLAKDKDPETPALFPNCSDPNEQREADILENVAGELMVTLIFNYCWRSQHADEQKRLRDNHAQKLKELSEFLGKRKWILGSRITYVDFMVYEAIYLHYKFEARTVEPYPNLMDYMTRFEQIPAIAEYMKTEKYVKAPCNSAWANFPF